MKRFTLFLLSVFVSSFIAMFAAPYGLLINGTTKLEATAVGEKDFNDREQFLVSCVALNQGDKVQLHDFGSGASWMCAIDPYGEYQKFTKNTDHLICNAAGSYDFYIKLKYEDDMLYIGPGQNCGNVTPPTPDPNATYYVTGSAELVGADKAWSETAIAMTKNADNTFTHTFTGLAAETVYRMKITNGTWASNWGFSAVQNAPAGVVGDADGNVVFALKTEGDVVVGFNGANITVQGDFTEDEPIKPVHGSSVPSECEDVMLQAFYYDSYRDGAPGDVVISGTTKLGNTKWATLLNQSGEIGTYFDLVWLPPSGKSEGGTGYHQTQYSNQNSDWGKQTELLEFINRMHAADTKVVADIVINHAGCKSSWCDFYPQNFGEYGTFQPDASWICSTDEVNHNPAAGEWYGKATGTDDGGYNMQDNYASARDWAHADPRVQEMMKAYLKWMKEVIGFDGWRYDYAQGFKGQYINMYNSAAANYFSVVEFWNGDMNNIKNYLQDVNWNTLAFDFGTKYSAIQGIADGDYAKCKGSGLLGAGFSKFAVTFVDSHDTYFGCQGGRDNNDEIAGCGNSMKDSNKDRVLGANAFILSMPGVPCVFYPHWAKYKDEIGKMVLARKAAGVHSESHVSDEAGNGYYKSTITGKHGSIRLLLGPNSGFNTTPAGYTLAYKGGNFAMYYTTTEKEVPVLSITPSAIYKTATYDVEMSAVALSGTPTIYYTTDGSDPITSATKQTYTGSFTIEGTVIVKAYAELNGVKSEVQEATYTYQEPQQTPLTVKFMPPTTWQKVYLYAWNGANLGAWPGMEWKTKDNDGWLYQVFPGDVREVSIIFSNGEGEQSNDIILDQDACYEWDGTQEKLSQNCSLSNIPFQLIVSPEGKVFKTETLSITMSTIGGGDDATIYYTLDGSDPKEAARPLTYTQAITINSTTTLKAYAESNGQETEVQTHTYTYETPQATPLTIAFQKPEDWTKVHLYAWNDGGATLYNGQWPGAEMTKKNAQGLYYFTFDTDVKEVNFIFNNGSGTQSADLWTDEDVCYGWKNSKAELIECMGMGTDVENITTNNIPALDLNKPMYNVLGQQVGATYRGIVIQNGHKYLR
ncbi:MAG: starch-binding protein [Paludibacteraceae bacterium]|nr:starch-binding protein [Paludibacteraceae bacterium]